MLPILARNWWAIALRGLFAVLFGVAAFVWPGLTLTVLVILWGAYALVDGIFTMVAAFRAAQTRMTWWPLILEGIVGIAAQTSSRTPLRIPALPAENGLRSQVHGRLSGLKSQAGAPQQLIFSP